MHFNRGFGKGYSSRKGFIFSAGTGAGYMFLPQDDLTAAVNTENFDYTLRSFDYNQGRSIGTAFSTQKLLWRIYNPAYLPNPFPDFDYIDLPIVASQQNIPWNVTYDNNIWMILPYHSTAGVAGTGNVYVSTDNGNSFSTFEDVLPSFNTNEFWTPAIYNADDGRWATSNAYSNTFRYSDDNGETWTSFNPGVASQSYKMAYGNGTWVVPDEGGTVRYSTDNMSSWSSVTPSGIGNAFYVIWNEKDRQFVLVGGSFNGTDFDARIYTSDSGDTWTARENGSKKIALYSVAGDDQGNYIAIGSGYSGGYIDTDKILYSTNNGVTWSEYAAPTTYGAEIGTRKIAYHAGTLEEDPFAPDTTPAPFNLYGIDLNTYTDYAIPTGTNTPTFVQGMYFNPDGDIMFINGSQGGANDYIFSYTLSTPFDVSTATYRNRTNALTGGYLGQVVWNDSGTNLYYGVRFIANSFSSFKKETPFDETSTNLASQADNVASDGRWPHPDATFIWHTNTNQDVLLYNLNADGVYFQNPLPVTYSDVSNSDISYIQWANNGTYFYAGCTNGKLKRFTCSTPYELNTRKQDQVIDFNSKFFMSHDGQYLFRIESGVIRRWSFT